MAETREPFLLAVRDGDVAQFLHFMDQNASKSEVFDIEELVTSLSHQQLESLWEGLMQFVTTALLNIEVEDDSDGLPPEPILTRVVTVAMASVKLEGNSIPQPLIDTVILLHAVLMTLPVSMDKLKTHIARLCETWWLNKLPSRSEVILQTLVYLLRRSLQDSASAASIKHIWLLHEALQEVDLDNESSEELKTMLQETAMSLTYLKVDEGRRFVSYLFSLSTSFIEVLHKVIKNQLPTCPKSVLDWYGEIYFRAWRVASGAHLTTIENKCIQDLMYHGIHAERATAHSLAFSLRKLLGYFHKQKKQRGVNEMLLRLYEPIMWRSLKVANGYVRANSLALLIDAFPLQNPDAPVEQTDSLMQKQFDFLQDSCEDPCPIVRVTAVQGVCRICNVFWEMIPAETLRAFISKLLVDIVWDSASSDVRVSVFKGLTFLLDNHLSHPVLKALLPGLRDFLHDSSEKVRVAFVDMLLKVKGMRAIKFWMISPMEHLLSRLAMDTPPVVRRIVSLIYNSFLPLEKPRLVQITRCVFIVKNNLGAARRFYLHGSKQMDLSESARYISMLCRCIIECIQSEQNGTSSQKSNERKRTNSPEANEDEEKENESEYDLSVEDTDAMAGLLDIITIFVTAVQPQLRKEENSDLKKKLYQRLSAVIPEFCKTFQDYKCIKAITLLASQLPPGMVPDISRPALSKLKSVDEETDSDVYGLLLESLCHWGRAEDVLEIIDEWLKAKLEPVNTEEEGKSKAKKRKSVTFAQTAPARPRLGLKFLSYLIGHSVCRQTLVKHHSDSLNAMLQRLKATVMCIEQRLTSGNSSNSSETDEFLTEALEAYCQLQIILADKERKEQSLTDFKSLVGWGCEHIVPHLSGVDRTVQKSGDKRPAADSHKQILMNISCSISEIILQSASTMAMVGIVDQDLMTAMVDFCEKCLSCGASEHFVCCITDVLYEMLDMQMFSDSSVKEDVRDKSVVPGVLNKILQTMATLIIEKQSDAEKVLQKLKGSLHDILGLYYCSLPRTEGDHDMMATLLAAVLAELKNSVKQEEDLEADEGVKSLPPLSSCLVNIISKRKITSKCFLDELDEFISCGAVENKPTYQAVLHLLYTLSQEKIDQSLLKICLDSLQKQIKSLQDRNQQNIDAEATEELMWENKDCQELMEKCRTHILQAQPAT